MTATALALVLTMPSRAFADASQMEFRENEREFRVTVAYAGRPVRSYQGAASGELMREFRPPQDVRGRVPLFLIGLYHGGNMCVANTAVVDLNRSPPFASDIFGSCGASIVVGRFDHMALSVRSDGSRPDDVWFYDGRAVRQLPRQSRAEHIRRAELALSAGNKPDAARHFLAVADHGDPRGPYGLGRMLREGDGVERDDAMARDLFTRAAELGHPAAMTELADMLREGHGGAVDEVAALRWLRFASARGDGEAQFALGLSYRDGDGTPQDNPLAFVWLRLAEANMARSDRAAIARQAAEQVAALLTPGEATDAAAQVAAFRPATPGPVWDLPGDWSLWPGRHALNRVRGATLFEMPAFAAAFRPLLGPQIYAWLPGMTGPGSITMSGDWLVVFGCRAHACNLENYILALRRDGHDAAACVMRDGTMDQQLRVTANMTFARMGAPRRSRDGVFNRPCPNDLSGLVVAAPGPGSSGSGELRRDEPMIPQPSPPRPSATGPARSPARGAPGERIGTGTAWQVAAGRFVTNDHVVQGCGSVRMSAGTERRPARVLARDPRADLALLETELTTPDRLPLRSGPPRPAEAVVVAGFPLAGLLASGAQVSTGIVTALAGIQDDPTRLQISAPIQPGNSGGPVLDRESRVVGMAVATISTLAATIATGSMPQNVNFAIKADTVLTFLRANGVQPLVRSDARGSAPMAVEDVAAIALRSVALVDCLR